MDTPKAYRLLGKYDTLEEVTRAEKRIIANWYWTFMYNRIIAYLKKHESEAYQKISYCRIGDLR